MVTKVLTGITKNWIDVLEILLLVLTGPVMVLAIVMLPALPAFTIV